MLGLVSLGFYNPQKELKKLERSIERQKDYPFALWDLAMFNIGYLCGLRSERGKLHQEHFNEPGGELFCTRLKNPISNTIRLDDKRKNLLKKYIREPQVKNGDPLFVSRKGNPISARQLDRLMKHYAGKAKLPEDKSHWHTLKHSIAVNLAESGADVKELQNYLGHKKIDSTMVYFQFTTKQQDANCGKRSGCLSRVQPANYPGGRGKREGHKVGCVEISNTFV